MKEQLISYDVAILAKEKGFGVIVDKYLYTEKQFNEIDPYDHSREIDFNAYDNKLSICTQSLLQKWLREVHKIHISISFMPDENQNKYQVQVHEEFQETIILCYIEIYTTYEEALEEGLIRGLELIK